jgi:hypothetical protein
VTLDITPRTLDDATQQYVRVTLVAHDFVPSKLKPLHPVSYINPSSLTALTRNFYSQHRLPPEVGG